MLDFGNMMNDEFASLSVPMDAKLKAQSQKWRMKAHDRAVDEVVALGFSCCNIAEMEISYAMIVSSHG